MQLLPVLTAAFAVASAQASPRIERIVGNAGPIHVPLTHHNDVKSMRNVVKAGKARIDAINRIETTTSITRRKAVNVPSANLDYSYIMKVSFGGKEWDLVVDTGSSYTWCGLRTMCEPTETGKATGGTIRVRYGSGTAAGLEYVEEVSVGGLVVKEQLIMAAMNSSGLPPLDGIIGFGPTKRNDGISKTNKVTPTFMENLTKQGSIDSNVLGVSFKPLTGKSHGTTNGQITLGGVDKKRYKDNLKYHPIIKTGLASNYWGVGITNITYGSKELSSAGIAIIDTGTTMIFVPPKAFDAFLVENGGQIDDQSGLAFFPKRPTENFSISINSETYSLTPDQYLIPADQAPYFGLNSSLIYTWIVDGGASASVGLDAIIGQKFLEHFYSVYDTDNSRVGFAPAV